MKKVKVVLWFPNPAKFPSVSTPMRFTKRGSVFTRLRIGDYMDLTEREAQTIGTYYHAGRYKLAMIEVKDR